MKKPRFLGVDEAANVIGVAKSNFIRDYANDPRFPEPIASLACGRIWLYDDVQGFLEDKRRGWLEPK